MLGATLYRILDTLLARIIRIVLESFLIRARIQDPRSRIAQESLPGILDLASGPESTMIPKLIRMIRASKQPGSMIQDPRSKIPGRSPKECWIQYLPESSESAWNHFDSGTDPRSKIPGRDSWAILDLGSWIPARIKNNSKMIRMIRASTGSKIH